MLKGFSEVNVVAQGKNGLEAVALIKEHEPDLVFLDVHMPGLDGFAVIKKLMERKLPMPQIVFATAYDHYAVQAFRSECRGLRPEAVRQSSHRTGPTACEENGGRARIAVDRLEALVGQLGKGMPKLQPLGPREAFGEVAIAHDFD